MDAFSGSAAYDDVGDDDLAAWDPEGDAGRKYLLNPTIFRLLGPLAGRRILDAGCGQGYLSRLMAEAGATVTGADVASRLVAYAERSERNRPLGIRYVRHDISRPEPLDETGFDAVVANMVLLAIADWEGAMASCLGAVRPGGQFIFSILHPCWPADAMATWNDHRRVELTEYLQPYAIAVTHGVNYHRPLSAYLDHARGLGAVISEIAEPAPPADLPAGILPGICAHIPNYLVVCVTRRAAT
jgi:2-polyprenyl-3-methyl-5-hydroxy-6-metoxy-1,4-benzoquinol methylase